MTRYAKWLGRSPRPPFWPCTTCCESCLSISPSPNMLGLTLIAVHASPLPLSPSRFSFTIPSHISPSSTASPQRYPPSPSPSGPNPCLLYLTPLLSHFGTTPSVGLPLRLRPKSILIPFVFSSIEPPLRFVF